MRIVKQILSLIQRYIRLKLSLFQSKYIYFLLALVILISLPLMVRYSIFNSLEARSRRYDEGITDLTAQVERLKQLNINLDKKLAAKIPRSYYLVVNSSCNEFYLYKGKNLVRKDKCSTGSYILLQNGDQQQWLFKTPKGKFRIQSKTTSPVWKKPDWAFVEEGIPVPGPSHHSRFEYGVLGDYALNLGNGYLIHGTLYQRFLGLPVTHGCIRLNDSNLELVYKNLQVGSNVFIF